MKTNRRTSAAKSQDLLVTVARSIGATLGAMAAKVNPSPRKSRRRTTGGKASSKRNLASKSRQRTSKRNGPAAGFKQRNQKKSAK